MRIIHCIINFAAYVVSRCGLWISIFLVSRVDNMACGEGPNTSSEWVISALFWLAFIGFLIFL